MLRCLVDDRPAKKIFVVAAGGTGPYCLVGDDLNYQTAMRWSADGRYLAYSATRKDRKHLFLVDTRDKQSVQLTGGDYNDIEPDIYGDVYINET